MQLTDQWLARVQKSVVRLESGCTASFVSPEGLVLTNHHCVAECLSDNSSAQRDLIANGFIAAALEDELKCQGARASVLMSTENITNQVTRAIGDVEPAAATLARNKVLTTLEANCEAASKQTGTPLACESVTLYQGGEYLALQVQALRGRAPGVCAGAGDRRFRRRPGQFSVSSLVSRHVAAARVRERQAGSTPEHLSFEWAGAKEGEPVFVAGHPGTTQRLLTAAQLKTQRDLLLPFWLLRFSELRGRIIQYSKTSPEAARTSKDYLDSIENAIKVRREQLTSLLDDRMMEQHAAAERMLREAVNAAAAAKPPRGAPGTTSPVPSSATARF